MTDILVNWAALFYFIYLFIYFFEIHYIPTYNFQFHTSVIITHKMEKAISTKISVP